MDEAMDFSGMNGSEKERGNGTGNRSGIDGLDTTKLPEELRVEQLRELEPTLWDDMESVYRTDLPLREKYAFFYDTLHRVCIELLSGLSARYTDFYSRLHAVCRLTGYPLRDIDRFRWRARHIVRGDEEADGDTFKTDALAFFRALEHFCPPADGNLKYSQEIELAERKETDRTTRKECSVERKEEQMQSIRLIINKVSDDFLYAQSKDLPDVEEMRIDFSANEQTQHAATLVSEGMQVNAVDCQYDASEAIVRPSLIVIDPDFLLDVTAVCRCLREYGDTALNHLLARISQDTPTRHTMLGNVAGQFLDDCINHPDIGFNESVRRAFLTDLTGFSTCEGIDAQFFADCKAQFLNIQSTLQAIKRDPNFCGFADGVLLEPTFFCETLGLQGRFDLLQNDLRNLIELKGGKWDEFRRQARREHLMQMILYKEILFHNLGCNRLQVGGYLLYSRYPYLQEQRTAREMVQHMMRLRNEIVILERRMVEEGFLEEKLGTLTPEDFNINGASGKLWQQYQRPQIEAALRPFKEADELSLAYFHEFFRFIAREQYVGRVGDGKVDSNRGMASLWNADLEQKRVGGDILIDLTVLSVETIDESGGGNDCRIDNNTDKNSDNNDKADINRKLGVNQTCGAIKAVTLLLPTTDDCQPNFRVGDGVILYERNSIADTPVTQQVVRCNVESYDSEQLTLRLRFPQRLQHLLKPEKRFAIEHDYADSGSRSLYEGLVMLLKTSASRRDLLLGRRRPESSFDSRSSLGSPSLPIEPSTPSSLSTQNSPIETILAKARAAHDYFLLVGPPGTGKTSVALRGMIDMFLADGKSLLLMAYTNRAVDEICEVLGDKDYIRIGRELTCDKAYQPHLLQNMFDENVKRSDVQQAICNARIVVSTVSSMTQHRSLFRLKQFDIAIFDEASQLLEPQVLPLLCAEVDGEPAIKKFILIGDHKQLPAVVVQDEAASRVSNPLLHSIGLTNCRNSFFERLHGLLEAESPFSATLNRQGRMHPDIANFASRQFYGGQLLPVGLKHQTEALPYEKFRPEETFVATTRLGFVDIPATPVSQRQPKMNQAEAEAIAAIVSCLQNLADENGLQFDVVRHVGIIVPFRRQIVAVRRELHRQGISVADDVMIDTVERYQGSQKDVIIYGTTISSPYELAILSNLVEQDGQFIDRKLNVAVTRARKQLFIVGNRQLLCSNPLYRNLIEVCDKSS